MTFVLHKEEAAAILRRVFQVFDLGELVSAEVDPINGHTSYNDIFWISAGESNHQRWVGSAYGCGSLDGVAPA